MRKITEDAFYGLNKINYKEIFETIKVLHNKSLFRYDGVNMLYETDKLEEELKNILIKKFYVLTMVHQH